MIVKNSEFKNSSRTNLKKDSFKYISSTKKIQNNSRMSRNSSTIGHPETLCMESHVSPHPQLRVPHSYVGNSATLPINPNLKPFSPPVSIGSVHAMASNFIISESGLDKWCTCLRFVLEIINFTNCHTWLFSNKYVHGHNFSVSWVREAILKN